MPPIISHSERQKIESSPTQTTGTHPIHPRVSIAFQSSQPGPVPSLTPPPPRHYLRNTTSSEKLQGLIQKRSDIYTRAQQVQQAELDSMWHSARPHTCAEAKVRPQMLTRSSSFSLATSVNPWKTQITRSASWRATGTAPGHHRRNLSTKSRIEVHVVEFESLGAQRRETMVLGLSEVDANLRGIFDSGNGASDVTHSSGHHELFDPNRGELEFGGVLGLTTTVEQKPVEIERPARDTQGSKHDSIPKLHQDAIDLNDDGTAISYHTRRSHFAAPPPNHSTTPHGFTLPKRRRTKPLQNAKQPKDLFPPPRGSSLVGGSLWLDPHASDSIATSVDGPSRVHPVGHTADRVDSHISSKHASHKSQSKCGGCKAVSKAIRHLGVCLRSRAPTDAPRPSDSL